MEKTFIRLAEDYFHYLVEEYKYSIVQRRISKFDPQINGRIEYNSHSTFVVISGEHGNINVIFGRLKDNERINGVYKYFLSPSMIYEYFSLSDSDKKLVYSLDPKDQKNITDLLLQKKLRHKKTNFNSLGERVENNLRECALWLRKYAPHFLRGDFSDWLKLYEYKVTAQWAAYIRSGKDEYVLNLLRVDENGKPIYKKKKVFQSSFDYLERLREEYQES